MGDAAIEKILNGRAVPAARRRQPGGWDLPVTTEHDVAYALKSVRRPQGVPFPRAIEVIEAIGRDGRWIGEPDLAEIVRRTGTTLKYLRLSIGRANRWMAGIGEYLAAHGAASPTGLRRGGSQWTGGLPTAVVLAGDSTSLAAVALTHALLAGGNAVVKGSSAEPLSPFRFVQAVAERGVPNLQLLFFDSSLDQERQLLRSILSQTAQSVVYGEDRTVAAIYGPLAANPAHKAVPYWSGRSGAIVLADADLEQAARAVVYGLHEDRGNRCNSTKKVVVAESVADELERLLVRQAEALRRGDPADEATDIGAVDQAARRLAEASVGAGRVVYDRDLIMARCDDESALVREEIPYPVLGIRRFDAGDDPVEIANRHVQGTPSGRSLCVSVITRNRAGFEQVAERLAAYKVLLNRPTTDVDLRLPHQGMHLFLELMRPKALVT